MTKRTDRLRVSFHLHFACAWGRGMPAEGGGVLKIIFILQDWGGPENNVCTATQGAGGGVLKMMFVVQDGGVLKMIFILQEKEDIQGDTPAVQSEGCTRGLQPANAHHCHSGTSRSPMGYPGGGGIPEGSTESGDGSAPQFVGHLEAG